MNRSRQEWNAGIVIAAALLLWLLSQTCNAQSVEKQLKKLECRCVSEKTFLLNGWVTLTQWDQAITVQDGRRQVVYYFKRCNKIGAREYYEIDNDDKAGFVIIMEGGIKIDVFTKDGFTTKQYSFETIWVNNVLVIKREPITQNGKQS